MAPGYTYGVDSFHFLVAINKYSVHAAFYLNVQCEVMSISAIKFGILL